MKKTFYPLLCIFLFINSAEAQILCIKAFYQNDSISDNVTNLLVNGGFENNTCISPGTSICPNSNNYGCDVANWTCTGGGTSTYVRVQGSAYTEIIEGIKAVYFGNALSSSCSSTAGDISCLDTSSHLITGYPSGYPLNTPAFGGTNGVSLQQTVNNLTIGSEYVLEFWTGGEIGNYFPKCGAFAVDLGFGDTMLKCKPTAPATTVPGITYVIEFKAIAASHTFKFTNWGHMCDSCTELFLDNVRLYPISQLAPAIGKCVTGVNDMNENNFCNVYPNPISNEMNITLSENLPSRIFLYDITARKLMEQSFISNTTLNTISLSKGIYYYEVRNKNGVVAKGKVIKE